MTDTNTQDESLGTYELTYLVRDEKDAIILRSILDRFEGKVSEEDELRKLQLSYPIEKEQYAFLGVLVFTMERKHSAELTTALNLEERVLRYIITNPIVRTRSEGTEEIVLGGSPVASSQKEESPTSAPQESRDTLSNEALQEKIEEILG